MKKMGIIFSVLVGVAILVLGVFFAVGYFKPTGAGLVIETTPISTVFINGEQVGRTPYEVTREPGEIVVKLIPESFETPLAPFETKVELVSGIKTIVKRELGETEDKSSGAVVSFEKISGNEVSIAVVSIPDAAQISIDGQAWGFAPFETSLVTAGEHQLTISSPGHEKKSLSVKAQEGYKLTAVFKLKPTGEAPKENEDEKHEEPQIEEVEILDTPTGFLRVRGGSSTSHEEIAQVEPGERYRYLETDEDTGWFKIELEDDSEGWVSNQYAKRVESETSPSPSPAS